MELIELEKKNRGVGTGMAHFYRKLLEESEKKEAFLACPICNELSVLVSFLCSSNLAKVRPIVSS